MPAGKRPSTVAISSGDTHARNICLGARRACQESPSPADKGLRVEQNLTYAALAHRHR